MEKQEILAKLQAFRERLQSDVGTAYAERGSSFGRERFAAWRRQFELFLDEALPGMSSKLDANLSKIFMVRNRSESDFDVFMREDGEPSLAFIDSLKLDVENDEFSFAPPPPKVKKSNKRKNQAKNKRVFIVHGHDELIKTQIARFIEKLGYEAIILHEQPSKSMTIIEKIERATDVGFAIVLYTPDDCGNTAEASARGELNPRARQNVVFEHGYLIAKLTRSHVIPLVSGSVELPSDIRGVVHVEHSNWQMDIAKEMKSAGYDVDLNRIVGS